METWKNTMTKTTMTISEPKQGVPIPAHWRTTSPLRLAIVSLKIDEFIEVDPFTKSNQISAGTWARRSAMKIKTRKSADGKLGIWRVK